MKRLFFLCVTACLLLVMMPVVASSRQADELYTPEAYPLVDKLEGEVVETEGRPSREPGCDCGAAVTTRKISETGFVNTGATATCHHAMAGIRWRNSITYVSSCTACGVSASFMTNVDEVRCALH